MESRASLDYETQTLMQILTAHEGDPDQLLSTKNDRLPQHYIFLRNGQHVELSPREWTCLKHLLQGLSAKEIARELDISFRTVEIYLVCTLILLL